MYSQDYDETILPDNLVMTSAPVDLQVAGSWATNLQPYLKNTQILFCPSFNEASLIRAMDRNDCDGVEPPGHIGLVPPYQGKYISHYGIAKNSVYWAGQCDQ